MSLHDNKYLRYFKGHTGMVVLLEMSPEDDPIELQSHGFHRQFAVEAVTAMYVSVFEDKIFLDSFTFSMAALQ